MPRLFQRCGVLRMPAVGTAHTTTPLTASQLSERAAAIKRKETTLWWLRALVVPGFMVYGLVVLRPTEGHFLRYLAERRHLEPTFNQLFPPLTREELSSEEGGAASPRSMPMPQHGHSPTEDKRWLQRKFHIDVTEKEDEERVARKRLLFGRDRSFSESFSDEYGVVVVKPAEERQKELELLALHPPMHVLRDQLDQLAHVSHVYQKRLADSPGTDDAKDSHRGTPALELVFNDRALFATAALVFHGPTGEEVKRVRFIGVCGMIWKQITH